MARSSNASVIFRIEDSLTPIILIVIRSATIDMAHVVMTTGDVLSGIQNKPRYEGIANDDMAMVTM